MSVTLVCMHTAPLVLAHAREDRPFSRYAGSGTVAPSESPAQSVGETVGSAAFTLSECSEKRVHCEDSRRSDCGRRDDGARDPLPAGPPPARSTPGAEGGWGRVKPDNSPLPPWHLLRLGQLPGGRRARATRAGPHPRGRGGYLTGTADKRAAHRPLPAREGR